MYNGCMKLKGFLMDILSRNSLTIFFVFYNFKSGQFSGREISKMAGLNPIVCLKILEQLTNLKLMDKKRVGASYLFSIRENMYWETVIFPLIKTEKNVFKKAKDDLVKLFYEHCEKIIIFGSYARGEETSDSDLDVCFVVKGSQNKIKKILETYEPDFHDRYLCHLSSYLITEAKYNVEKVPIIKEIKKEGVVIYG